MGTRVAMKIAAVAIAAALLVACSPPADDDQPVAPAATTPMSEISGEEAPQRAVVAESLAYAEVDKKLVKGHFAFPEDMVDPLPAVVLIHEWWGLNDNIRRMADRLASAGFIVLAVDLFDNQTAEEASAARELMLAVVERPESVESNILQAADWLRQTTGAAKVAVVGFGFGGGWSIHAAAAMPDKVDASVIYYGQVSSDADVLQAIQAPVLGFFGSDDSAVPEQSVNAFQEVMEGLRKEFTIEIYESAKGGFADPGSRNFREDIATKSWQQMVSFLQQHLAEN